MKSIVSYLLAAILLICFLGCVQEQFIKLKEADVDKQKVEFATEFVSEYFYSLKSGLTYDFSEIAIREFANQMSAQLQKETYEQLKLNFGDFKSLKYYESWKQNEINGYDIIRIKGTFEYSDKPLEIRVVINNSNKLVGFWVKPWVDNLNNL